MPNSKIDSSSCISKQDHIKSLFATCTNADERYDKIIDLGRQMAHLDPVHMVPENLVKGCQSQMYLHSSLRDGRIYFEAESDALIAQGLASLLLEIYSGEPPEVVLQCPPTFLEELGIADSLSPSRANGLYSLHLRMKQSALHYLSKGTPGASAPSMP